MNRRQEDLDKQAKLEEKERNAALKKFKRNPAKHAEDMSLITDKNMDGKRGWKRGRFGRPVITMKLDKVRLAIGIILATGACFAGNEY